MSSSSQTFTSAPPPRTMPLHSLQSMHLMSAKPPSPLNMMFHPQRNLSGGSHTHWKNTRTLLQKRITQFWDMPMQDRFTSVLHMTGLLKLPSM